MAHSNSVLNNVGTTIRSKKRVILRLLDLSIREYYFPGNMARKINAGKKVTIHLLARVYASLFVAEGFDWIELSSFAGGVDTEENTDRAGKDED